MSVKIKVPVSKIQRNDTRETIIETLKSDSRNAYTVSGLMLEKFGVKKSDIEGKPWNQWKKGQPTLYSRIRKTLDKLVKEGKVNTTRDGKADVYWWKQ